MAMRKPRARGNLEREVLACLAAAGRPLTASDVHAEIGGLAYTTVMTTLARLHAKGALDRQPKGRAYEYALAGGPAGAQSNMAAHQMLRVLDVTDDRAGVLARFVAELTPEDGQLLSELLDETSNSPAPPRRRTT
jgi:predicted transcriptional regulator